jgi:hypothetical protein
MVSMIGPLEILIPLLRWCCGEMKYVGDARTGGGEVRGEVGGEVGGKVGGEVGVSLR